MSKVRDLNGQVFGRLKVIGFSKIKDGAWWFCQCECGAKAEVRSYSLVSGNTKSCGCLNRDIITKHGKSISPENRAWINMKDRCYNPKCISFPNYFSKGITVCDRWLESFENFYEDMGERPSKKHSLDRIDNDKGYSPDNCRWADKSTQKRNQGKKKFTKSKYKWITPRGSRWIARGWDGVKRHDLGSYEDEITAAKAADSFYREFGYPERLLNFPNNVCETF